MRRMHSSISRKEYCLPLIIFWSGILGYFLIASPSLYGADPQDSLPAELRKRVVTAKERGTAWLVAQPLAHGTAEGSLVGYALLKSQVSPDHPSLLAHAAATVRKIDEGAYAAGKNPLHHTYEAGCDAMFLEALDPQRYQPQLRVLQEYLVREQRATGAWHYPNAPRDPIGDTSISQYGILGLWAIERAGIQVPRETWARAGKFLTTTQRSNGGFTYHPYGGEANRPTTPSMTAAGLGSTLVVELMLYGVAAPKPTVVSRRKFGVLEPLYDETPEGRRQSRAAASGETVVSRDALKNVIPPAEKLTGAQFTEGLRGPHPLYFLYGCERIGALRGNDTIGTVKWYEDGCNHLVGSQAIDGEWEPSSVYSSNVTTSFALLFLARATQSLVPKPRAPRSVGGGLLVGGRGLPDDLSSVAVDSGTVEQRLPKGEIDALLSELEQPTEVTLPTVQQTLVEIVAFDHPEQLVGQVDRLHRLISHPSPEVRQLAVWALARSGDYREIPRLIDRLKSDADLVVAWEASLGLCWLSRLPQGIIPAGASDPLPIAPPGIGRETDAEPDPELMRSIEQWRSKSATAWDAWYQLNRPYEERNDVRDIRRKR